MLGPFLVLARSAAAVTVLLCAVSAPVRDASQSVPISQLDTALSSVTRANAPGCAAAAMQSGRIVWSRAAGLADIERHVPLTTQTKFLIASTSKQFTAMSAVLLALDGRLSLDDDIRRYVPEVPDFGASITIRHLLWHTSGLREESNLLVMAGWRSSDLETENDILGLLHRQARLNFRPGEEFLYSNTGYMLLATIVSRVSGMTFPEFVAQRIFRPLGMIHSTVVDDPGEVVQDRALGYWGTTAGPFRLARIPYGFAGPTGVVTTLEDLARWDANAYTFTVGGQTAQDMISAPGRLNDGSRTGYGFGAYIGTYKGHRMISHAGSDPGFKADYLRFPDQRLAVAVLCNSFDIEATPVARQLADVLIAPEPTGNGAGVATDNPVPLPAGVAELAGRYWNSDVAQVTTILFEQRKLLVDGGTEGKFELRHIGGNHFLLPAAPRRYVLTFFRAPDGSRRLRKEIAGERPREFVAVESQRLAVPFSDYAGVFYSAELDVEWTIRARDGALRISFPRFDEEPLVPILPNVFQFSSGFFTLEFAPPTPVGSAQFDVTTERARHMRFTRLDKDRMRQRKS
jgi:CubicO group peptidase (beta-lactamase class C family)